MNPSVAVTNPRNSEKVGASSFLNAKLTKEVLYESLCFCHTLSIAFMNLMERSSNSSLTSSSRIHCFAFEASFKTLNGSF